MDWPHKIRLHPALFTCHMSQVMECICMESYVLPKVKCVFSIADVFILLSPSYLQMNRWDSGSSTLSTRPPGAQGGDGKVLSQPGVVSLCSQDLSAVPLRYSVVVWSLCSCVSRWRWIPALTCSHPWRPRPQWDGWEINWDEESVCSIKKWNFINTPIPNVWFKNVMIVWH